VHDSDKNTVMKSSNANGMMMESMKITLSNLWSNLIKKMNETDASEVGNNIVFWVLSGLYGLLVLVGLIQLLRIHLRVREYGFTIQKLFHILVVVASASRCITFGIYPYIVKIMRMEHNSALAYVLLDFPSLIFFTTYTLLILFWAEIYNQARSLSIASLKPLFITINVLVYLVSAGVWIYMLVSDNTESSTQIDTNKLGYQISSLFIALMFALVVLGFLFYGTKLSMMLRKFPIESKGRKKKLYEVGLVTATCCCAFTIRVVMIAVNAFIKEVRLDVFGHPLYDALYYALVEIIPTLLVLFVLRKLPPKKVPAETSSGYKPIPIQP